MLGTMLRFVQVVLVDYIQESEITVFMYLGATFPESLIDNFQPPSLRNPLALLLGQDSHLFETTDLEDLGFRPFKCCPGAMF
jgi:hypothetical protein